MERKTGPTSNWLIVAMSFCILGIAYGVWYSFSVFFVALLKEFGWDRSMAAGAFSVMVILHGVIGPFAGHLADRLGPRRVMVLGAVIVGTGLILCSRMQTWWQFYLFFGVIAAVGVGMIGMVPNTTLIQFWFREKMGLAMGIVTSGIGFGVIVCGPVVQLLIDRFGWRMSYLLIGVFVPTAVGTMAISILKNPLPMMVSERSPSRAPGDAVRDPLAVNEEWTNATWTVRKALHTSPFWFLAFAHCLGGFTVQSMLAHQVAFFVDEGLTPLLASSVMSAVGFVSIGGKILWGALSDRIGREITFSAGMTCTVLGMISVISFHGHHVSSLPYLYALFYGLGYGMTAALPPLIAADFFQGRGYGEIFGTVMLIGNLGGAFGAWFAGFVYDKQGSYIPIFVLTIGCALLACLSVWKAAPRKVRSVPGRRVRAVRPSSSDP